MKAEMSATIASAVLTALERHPSLLGIDVEEILM